MRIASLLALLSVSLLLSSCDALGIESGTATAARKEADGKAIGSACRHAMRAIEDCYTLNGKASKAAVYAGWREMDEYMRENKIEGVVPVIPRKVAKPAAPASAPEGEDAGHGAAGPADGGHGGADKAGKADAEAPRPGDEAAPRVKAARKVATAPREQTTH